MDIELTAKYLFADEAGCFTFNRNPNISIYFIICTVSMRELSVGKAISDLRHMMIWNKDPVGDYFHATTDSQRVRDQVFEEIVKHDIEVQATICEKPKAQPQVRLDKSRFYKYPWYYQFKHGISKTMTDRDDLLVTAASIGSKKERTTFINALDDVMQQTVPTARWAVDFRPSQCDPCLQVADYCAWAIQRKWERGDTRSYDIVKHLITYEYELWGKGTVLYY